VRGGRRAGGGRRQRNGGTLAEFKPRFIEGHVKANRLKPSTAEAYESVFRTHREPAFGSMRVDAIGDELVQRFKGELVEDEMANKSINNVLTALSVMLKRAAEWKAIDVMPCRIRLLKWDKGEVAFYDFAEYHRLVAAAAAIDRRIELLTLLGGDATERLPRRSTPTATSRARASSTGTTGRALRTRSCGCGWNARSAGPCCRRTAASTSCAPHLTGT
jgi:Phage integrase, N-terminal SAM-like domain